MDSMPGMDHGDSGGNTNVTTGSTSGMSHNMMNMGGMGGMEMTFTDWSSYKLTLLLSSWTITKPWQFFLTWVLVFLATILLHAFRFAISGLDCMIANTAKSNPGYKGTHDTGAVGEASAFQTSRRLARPNGWIVLKLLHGLMMGCQYGLSLLLMLVSFLLLIYCAYDKVFAFLNLV
jgi:Ctr copper transporter family